MAGEVNEPSHFDVTTLECFEIETATGEQFQSNIIDWGEQFFLRATFTGDGAQWSNMVNNGFGFIVQFFAEGMGPGVADLALGTVNGNLVPGTNEYTVDSAIATVNAQGVYRCGVTVSFRVPNGNNWFGVLGFNEDCVILIHPSEEIG